MDKSAIRNFAIEARKILMKSAITEAGFYGITKEGCKSPIQKGQDFEVYETLAGTENRIFGSDIKRRTNLVHAIEEEGFDQVIEETAYTWFNRIIAIRFMEVNDYLPTRVRVLSSETGSNTPDIVTQSLDVDLNMTPEELEKVQQAKDNNKYDEAFRLLFIKQCNELNDILPGLFEKTDDYMELLLKLSYTGDGVVRMLVDTVPEDSFNVETEGQVEIIGWMYQYYNTELKDDTFAKLKKNVKISKERIPAATQLFTPDWIVRYMVENSVGRIWIEHLRANDSSIDEKAKAEEFGWKYYLPEAEQEAEVQAQLIEARKSYKDLTPMDITCIDPCMGSGHILVYMFDVLMDIYRSEGYNERDSVFDILEKNIHGLDIDRRAYQLSYFALMMKARGYNRRLFRKTNSESDKKYELNVYFIDESNSVNRKHLNFFGSSMELHEKENARNTLNKFLDNMVDAKEYGSILNVEECNWDELKRFIGSYDVDEQLSFETLDLDKTYMKINQLIKIGYVMSMKYCVVATNPPYMGLNNGDEKVNEYAKNHFKDSKSDLFAVFIEKCQMITKKNFFSSMITQHSWMFISTYEKLRKNVISNDIINMLHLGARAFDEIAGEVVQTTAFVRRKTHCNKYMGCYARLVSYQSENEKENAFSILNNRYYVEQSNFDKIPGNPISYWADKGISDAFGKGIPLSEIAVARNGMKTGANGKYVRTWWEVDYHKTCFTAKCVQDAIDSKKKWFPYNKGGEARKWYGNNEYIVNWENGGYEIFKLAKQDGRNVQDYPGDMKFTESGTWSLINTGNPTFRYKSGNLSDIAGMSFYQAGSKMKYLLGFCNSSIATEMLQLIAPTINYQAGDIGRLPIIFNSRYEELVNELVDDNIEMARNDDNEYEVSWDFSTHPMIDNQGFVEESYIQWQDKCMKRKENMFQNENQINDIFYSIYGLSRHLEDDINITIRVPIELTAVKSLISYAVGCMFGRYSLDAEGIVYAGGEWKQEKYQMYLPDVDGIIPITDENYFEDDIVARFVEFISLVYGENHLEMNLDYIANVLGNKGDSSRDKIRNYFIMDFYKDHCNMYSATGSGKRPIYWLFDSGKENGFKVLIYIHRYSSDTVGIIRSDYLHRAQDAIERTLQNVEYIITSTSSAVDKARATKARDKYIKQLSETRLYYQALSHIALQRIELDLDDGVKANYAKFQGVEISNEGTKKQIIDLLAKI